jgi:hypothetical protein
VPRRTVLLLALLGCLATAPAAHADRRTWCRHPPAERELVRTRLIRVFRLAGGTYFACARERRSPPVVLGYDDRSEHSVEAVRQVRAAGGFAAAEQDHFDDGYVERTVTVWDVVHRRLRWHIPTGVSAQCVAWYGTGGVSDLVLRPTGAVAWITRHSRCSQAPGLEVHRADRRGTTLLMTDPAVQPGSLALDGDTISWTVGSLVQSTDLL